MCPLGRRVGHPRSGAPCAAAVNKSDSAGEDYSTIASCPLFPPLGPQGAPQPLPLAAGKSLACTYNISPGSTRPAMFYAKAFLSNGATAQSAPVNVKF